MSFSYTLKGGLRTIAFQVDEQTFADLEQRARTETDQSVSAYVKDKVLRTVGCGSVSAERHSVDSRAQRKSQS